MSRCHILNEIAIERTPRLMQVEGMFDLSADVTRKHEFIAELPLEENDWQIGLIVGASGSGKTSLLREAFGRETPRYEWPHSQCAIDGFPISLSVKDIVGALCAVGFSSPPSWRTPFRLLSTGEQFRVTLARALCESPDDVLVMDEFTSVVDRTVGQIGSAAFAKAIRAHGKRAVLASCHRDIIEWLCPDWVWDMDVQTLARGHLQRPSIELSIYPCSRKAWGMFRQHHYLSGHLNNAALCFIACRKETPVGFTAAIHAPHKTYGVIWREHRTVCLPDYQGVGIGTRLSDWLGSLLTGAGHTYYSRTSHPAMIAHRRRSSSWAQTSHMNFSFNRGSAKSTVRNWKGTATRLSQGFRFVGPPMNATKANELFREARAVAA